MLMLDLTQKYIYLENHVRHSKRNSVNLLHIQYNKPTEAPWPFNYSTTHLVHHDLPQVNFIFFAFFYFVFCSTFATNPTNLTWTTAPLWSYRAFTYRPFSGLMARQYNLHLYSPLHTNMIWRLCL